MRVQADNRGIAVRQIGAEILHLVGKAVGCAAFHRRRQIENNFIFTVCTDCLHDLVTNIHRVFRFRAHKAFRRILVTDVAAGFGRRLVAQGFNQLRAVDGNFRNTRHILLKYDFALQFGSGVVKMHNHILCPVNRLKGFPD